MIQTKIGVLIVFSFFILTFLFPSLAISSRVLLIVNKNSPLSQKISHYYKKQKSIPQENICHIEASTKEEISRSEFITKIKMPIIKYIKDHQLQDQILYIVTTKGVPLKIKGKKDRASVDSELCLIYREMVFDMELDPQGAVSNPYFGVSSKKFDHKKYDIYLVTRLTGYNLYDIKKLIDYSLKASSYSKNKMPPGMFVFDLRGNNYKLGNNWLRIAAERLKKSGFKVSLEQTSKFLTHQKQVMGYASWGSNDARFPGRHIYFNWLPGALASTFVSTNARTFKTPLPHWKTDGSQSLIGDLITEGVTGVAGNAYEPYLRGCVRPDILFPGYISGLNLAESFYKATPFLSWQTVVVGDPLCCPFGEVRNEHIKIPPNYFKERHLHFSMLKNIKIAQAKFLLARIYLSIKDVKQAEKTLKEAIKLNSQFIPAYMALAMIYSNKDQASKAKGIYKKVLSMEPDYPPALNNLAFIYAEEKRDLDLALKLVKNALSSNPKNPEFLDTLGWVYYQKGNHKKALATFKEAIALSPQAIIYYHLGKAYLKLGEKKKAKEAFQKLMMTGQVIPKIKEVEALL